MRSELAVKAGPTGLSVTGPQPLSNKRQRARPGPPWSVAGRFILGYLDSGASQYAGMLAFSLLVSLLPQTLGILTVFGLLAGSVGHQQRLGVLRQLLVDMFPAAAQGAVSQVVFESADHLGAVALLSVIGLIWFSTGVFSTTGFAINRIFGMPDRTFIQQRLRGLWMPLAVFVSAYLALAVNFSIGLWSIPAWLGLPAIWVALTYFLGFLYAFAPSRRLRRSDLLPGAGLAAAAIVGLAYAFPLYTQLAGHLGSESRFFAAVFGLVAWVYFIAQAMLGGAVFNRMRLDARHGQNGYPGNATGL